MIFMINFNQLDTKIINNEKYSLYLNEVRKNLTANLDRSPLFRDSLATAMHRRAIDQPCLPYFP